MKSIILALTFLAVANAAKFPTGLAPCRKYITVTNYFNGHDHTDTDY